MFSLESEGSLGDLNGSIRGSSVKFFIKGSVKILKCWSSPLEGRRPLLELGSSSRRLQGNMLPANLFNNKN
jgi:hypothetical protein